MKGLRHKFYLALGRSHIAGRLAARVRKEAGLIVGYYFAEGWSQEGATRVLAHIGPSVNTFVDVGANVGNWTRELLQYASPGAQGLLFEPGLSAMARLRDSLGANSNLTLVEAALSDSIGEAVFYEEQDAGEWSSLVAANVHAGATPRTVNVLTLDRALGDLGVEQVDYLKVDAEGYDLHVLRGAAELLSSQRVRYVQFEYNVPWAAAGSTLAAATAFLGKHGYSTYVIRSDGLYELSYKRFGEFFACANFLAAAPSETTHLAPLVRGRL